VPEGWQLAGYDLHSKAHQTRAQFRVVHDGVKQALDGTGQGLIEALVDAVRRHFNVKVTVRDFDEHAMTPGTEAMAIASIMLEVDGETVAACCIDEDSSRATLQATLSAVGRSGAVRARLREAV
jgi:2-isopropylmalate synthase